MLLPHLPEGARQHPWEEGFAFSPHPPSGKFCALIPGGLSKTVEQGLGCFIAGQSPAEAGTGVPPIAGPP